MQCMRRFFVPGSSTICGIDDVMRKSLPREGVAALPYTEREIGTVACLEIQILCACPYRSLLLKILRVGADRCVRPHRSALRFQCIQLLAG